MRLGISSDERGVIVAVALVVLHSLGTTVAKRASDNVRLGTADI